MAVALVVVAVPLLTVLVSREVRALQQRIVELEERLAGLGARAGPVALGASAGPVDTGAGRDRSAEIERRVEARTTRAVVDLEKRLVAQQREQLLDVLRTLSAMRPAEPEFTDEYYLEARAGRD